MYQMQKILAVDDDKDILEILKYILEDSGYEVETLADGGKLLEKVKAKHPDLILLDIMLAGFDGRELCKLIKSTEDTKDIPIIMISASHNMSDISRQSGAPDDFIAKPFDISVLLDKVGQQLAAA